MKLNGFNFFICGTSKITDLHLKTIKRINGCNLKFIYGENIEKRNYLSRKFNVPVCKKLNKFQLKECNVAIITNGTSKHLKSLFFLLKYINNIIIEKPIVGSIEDLEKLKKYLKKDSNIIEVSQYLFCKKIQNIKPKTKCIIKVRKHRDLNSYKNYNNEYDLNKSAIINQFPHWLDIVNYLSNGKFNLHKIYKFKSSLNTPFFDKVKAIFRDLEKKDVYYTIDLSYAEKKNQPTKIFFENKSIILDDNVFIKTLKKIFFKLTKINYFLNYREKIFLNMYKYFLQRIKNKKKLSFTTFYKKIFLLKKLENYNKNFKNYLT